MRPDPVQALERVLCEYYDRSHCVYAGRGATAIYAVLRAIEAGPGEVVMPTVLCPSPANATLYAGHQPLFCDISLTDFMMDLESVERVLATARAPRAIIAVDLFGEAPDLDRLQAIAKRHGAIMIEDAAQSMGGEYRGRRMGSIGDVSILSFGHTKILDVGSGGALLTDNADLASRARFALADLARGRRFERRAYDDYRRVYYTLRDLAKTNPRLNDLFLPLPDIYRDMYLIDASASAADAALAALPRLGAEVSRRRENAAVYRERLQHPMIRHPRASDGGVPWRYSILLGAPIQDAVTRELRARSVDVSTWYPPLHRWYESGKRQMEAGVSFGNAEHLEHHILNLWVEPRFSTAQIHDICDTVLDVIERAVSSNESLEASHVQG